MIVRGGDLFGEGVNIAARLESIAEPGALCVSGVAYDYVKQSVPFTFYDLGPQAVKNIDQPVRAYATRLGRTGRTVELKSLPLPDRPSIAVLPFANMSGDPEQEYFADGVVEEIVTALSHIKWLFVIAPTSSFTYKGRAVDLKQIGRELGVRYILEGSLRKLGNRVRIAGQLIEAATGAHLWADRFDGELSRIFELQDEVAERVVGAIEPSLRSAEIERTRSKPTENLDAYDLYLRGQFELTQLSQETYAAAADLFRRAIALDPNYSDAHAALADSVGRSFAMGWIDDYEWARNETCQAARRAITSDPENATSLASAAWALALFEGHFDEALELADRAVRLHPNSAWVHTQAGFVHTYAGENDPAVAHFFIARRLSPVDPRGFITFVGLGVAHFVARRFEEAEKAARRGIAQMTRNTASRRLLAASLAHLGRVEEAREVVKELLILQPKFTLSFTRRFPRYRPSWMPELLIDGLRKAGVPE